VTVVGYFCDPVTGGPARLELLSIDGHAFQLLRSLEYRSDDHDEPFVFPVDLEHFRTDMASVPSMFGWLVPRSGVFLPAAVLHDALTAYGDESGPGAPAGDYRGPQVDRVEADRLFRMAMGDLGTGRIRKWLMWAAVTLPTMWVAPRHRLWLRTVLVATLGIITVLGLLATADLVDLWNGLPWMGARPWWQELLGGAAGAVVVPALLALLWGRHRLAGLIAGWALAFLVHVTLAIIVIHTGYLIAERLVSGPRNHRFVHPGLRSGR